MNFRSLSEYRRHGRACWRPDPVVNDPFPKFALAEEGPGML
jgi:hypothetical protein